MLGKMVPNNMCGISQYYKLLMSTFKNMAESSSVSEYKRHKEYLKRHTVYKESGKLLGYFQRWKRNKRVCITLIFHWPCSIRTEPFKIMFAVVMYCCFVPMWCKSFHV